MSQVIEEVTIEHLDFQVDEDDVHFKHPTNPDLYWCGSDVFEKGRPYSMEEVCPPSMDPVKCNECRKLARTQDWWAIHNRHFGSSCHAMFRNTHNCGA